MTQLVPSFRAHWNSQHQFAICGGEQMTWAASTAPGERLPRVTNHVPFLERFLRDSAF